MTDATNGVGTTNGQATGGNTGNATAAEIDLNLIKTPSGKGIADFKIPAGLLSSDPELVDYIIKSESMKDSERQYWFNLWEVMNQEQREKLRDILARERKKLAEIDAKYGKKPKIDPVVAAKQAEELARKRAAEQKVIADRERKQQEAEAKEEADVLAELEGL